MASLAQLDQFDFHHRLRALSAPTLVMFGSHGCGGCRHLRPVLLTIARQRPDWQVFEVDVQRDPGLVHEYEVFHLPTLLLFNDGHFHCELKTEARAPSIIEATLDALRRPAEEAP